MAAARTFGVSWQQDLSDFASSWDMAGSVSSSGFSNSSLRGEPGRNLKHTSSYFSGI